MPTRRQNGFTIIEIAIVILIVSLIIAGFAKAFTIYITKEKHFQLKQTIEDIQATITEFVSENGYYPCPAPLNASPDTTSFGTATDCSNTSIAPGNCSGGICITDDLGPRVRIGAIPFRQLDISAEKTIDPYKNRITYAVTEQLAISEAAYETANGLGGLNVVDNSNVTLLDTNNNGTLDADERAKFILFSHGKNGSGAYTYSGTPNDSACTGSALDIENCDNNAVFRSSEFSQSETMTHFDDRFVYNLNYSNINVSCADGEYLVGIQNGQPVCADLTDFIEDVLDAKGINNIAGFACSGSDKVAGFNNNFTPYCGAETPAPAPAPSPPEFECTSHTDCGGCGGETAMCQRGSCVCVWEGD